MTSIAQDIGAPSDFEPGIPYPVQLNGRTLVIVRKENAFYALRNICPHQGAPLSDGHISGTPPHCKPGDSIPFHHDGEVLICPWHGWEFSIRTGCSFFDPDRVRVATYPVKIENNRVVVEL